MEKLYVIVLLKSYKDGKLNGWWRKWEENGSLFLETEYVDGEMVSEIDFN